MKISTVALVALTATSFLTSSCHGLSSVQTPTTATAAAKASTTNIINPALLEFDYQANDKLPWLQEGYHTWTWGDHKINYLELGDKDKPALLLIHGFGASSYHWRYNVPELARDYHVFAIDLLGFGLSDKPLEDYSAKIWADQAAAFITDVIDKPTTVAGNSLGGFTALYTSTLPHVKDMIQGCVLLNGAGRFKPEFDLEEEEPNALVDKLKEMFQRMVIQASFLYTKQPARIEQVLRQVYPVNASNVDPELVASIQFPSTHENAAEVFYRVITKNGGGPSVYIDDLLEAIDCPLLLCWGEQDPWIKSAAADKIQQLKPSAQRVSIDAGHCPHDEAPAAVNAAIRQFMESL